MSGGFDGPLASDTPSSGGANDNQTEGTKIDVGGGKTVTISKDTDLNNTHLGGHVSGDVWKGPVSE